ncbi:hypothetical protein [Rhizobium oryzicola]|uniref:Uncharacterized protein n=1 Tax=Rhizobium oryzicola TaxID=1232668 RepID=A0ABT8SWU8_9HYPH|nr:hypothetical protein [Rhizobium oryzicola]MDO1582909.1 hypothetical protein [Rhizobium oryzicola]
MQISFEERLDLAAQIMDRLIDQNHSLTSRVIALENVLALLIAHQFRDAGTADDDLGRFGAEVSGTAIRIADLSHREFGGTGYAPVEVSTTMERILSMAEGLIDAHR